MLISFIKRILIRLRKNGFSIILNYIFVKYVFRLKPFISPVMYESINMYLRLGYWPNLKNPKTLNEKLVNRKLFKKITLFSEVADKFKVRKYISNKVDQKILNELYYVGDDPSKIPFDHLPQKFVIKANHGSGWNIIVRDKNEISNSEIIEKCNQWMGTKYTDFSNGYEAHYDTISPLILVEKFLEGIGMKPVIEYKFFCFHGIVKFLAVDTDKQKKSQNRYIYDIDWNLLEFKWPEFPRRKFVLKPSQINEMIQIAEELSKDFEFCRIDLYLCRDGIKFGEITICPGGGWDKISPRIWDSRLGEQW